MTPFTLSVTDAEELAYQDKAYLELIYQMANKYDIQREDSIKAYLNEISGFDIASEKELQQYFQEGHLNKIYEGYLKRVVMIASQYIGNGTPLLDLIQEGNLALLEGIHSYSKNLPLLAFLNRKINNCLKTNRLSQFIDITSADMQRIDKIKEVQDDHLSRWHYEASPRDIADEMKLYTDDVIELQLKDQTLLSLDQEVEDETIGDYLSDANYQLALENDEIIAYLNDRLNVIPEYYNNLLRFCYGLEDGEKHTLDECITKFGLKCTRETMRTHLAKALRLIRNRRRHLEFIWDTTFDPSIALSLEYKRNNNLSC